MPNSCELAESQSSLTSKTGKARRLRPVASCNAMSAWRGPSLVDVLAPVSDLPHELALPFAVAISAPIWATCRSPHPRRSSPRPSPSRSPGQPIGPLAAVPVVSL